MPNLYDLSKDLWRLVQEADTMVLEDGELESWMEDALDAAQDEVDTKIQNIAGLVKQLEAEASQLSEELTRLSLRRQAHLARVVHLKQYLTSSIQAMPTDHKGNHPKFFGRFKVRIQPNPYSLDSDLIDLSRVPQEYWEPQEPRLMKRELTQDCKNGREIPGTEKALPAEPKYHVRII